MTAAGTGVASAQATFSARGSVEQVYVTGLAPGAEMSLLNSAGHDDRHAAGRIRWAASCSATCRREAATACGPPAGGEASGPLTVLSTQPAPPSTAIYNQAIPSSGYGYLTTRDGTKLVDLRAPAAGRDEGRCRGVQLPPIPSGPTPTLIEYSGYGYADPAGPQSGISILANLMGFTVVDVNMRGTGCSGGAFDFFEPLQSLDGYDVIETIARQPWVLHHKVGMMGISYGGISQLFTAQTNPPSLAAISPLSVLDSTQTTLYPGGILNTGFAVAWAQERIHDAQPASPTGGQPWAYQRIQEGDATCAANQDLHPEAADLMAKIRANDHYVPSVADPLSPITFVDKINVPVFMACQWTDEQTGGHCPTLAKHFTGTQQQVVHVHQRHARRLARPGDLQPLVRLPPALRRATGADPELSGHPRRGARDLPGGHGDHGRDDAARPDPAAAHLRDRVGGVRAAAVDPRPLRQWRRRRDAGPPGPRLRAARGRASRSRAPPPAPGTSGQTARSATAARDAQERTRSPGTPTRGR